jgi:hypothetical protein
MGQAKNNIILLLVEIIMSVEFLPYYGRVLSLISLSLFQYLREL